MPSVPSDTNLSLGKLMRAAKHDTVSNYTTETELGNDCGNTTTANLYANAFNVPYLTNRGLI